MAKQAIAGKRLNAFGVDPSELVIIGLDTTDTEAHPLYDPRIHLEVSEGLVLNVMYRGVLKPILVTPNGETVEVVDGRQRVRAAREANRRLVEQGKDPISVPCMVKRGDGAELFGVSRSANEFHQGDDAMTKSRHAQRMLDMGKSDEEVALTFGITRKTLGQWLSLLSTSTTVQAAVETGSISASAAADLAKLRREEQDDALDKLLTGTSKPTRERAKAAVREKQTGEKTDLIGKVTWRKLCAEYKRGALDEIEHGLTPDMVAGIQLVLGWRSPSSIKGLVEMLRQVSGK